MTLDLAETLWELEERLTARFMGTRFPFIDSLRPEDIRAENARKVLRKLRINRYRRRMRLRRLPRCAYDSYSGQRVQLYGSTRTRFTTRITYPARAD